MICTTVGFERLSFLDAYSGYNQIVLAEEDQEKKTFITKRGLYCFKVMPFGPKNAGATYQRLMNKMFKELTRDIMEVYIDAMCVKSKKKESHIKHLTKVFAILRRVKLKLNPAKYDIRVSSGQFL